MLFHAFQDFQVKLEFSLNRTKADCFWNDFPQSRGGVVGTHSVIHQLEGPYNENHALSKLVCLVNL